MKNNCFSLYYALKVEKKVTKGLPLVRTICWIIEGTKKKKNNSKMEFFFKNEKEKEEDIK